MNKFLSTTEAITFVLGISMVDVEHILSIVALSLSILIGLINIIFKIAMALKDGKIDEQEKKEIMQEITEVKDDLDNLK